jgi:hypothetical protein
MLAVSASAPLAATTRASPGASAVTSPLVVTLATAGSADVHATVL